MTTETGAPAAEQSAAPAIQDDGISALTIEDARALLDQRMNEPDEKPGDGAEKPATPDKTSAPGGDDVDPEPAPHDDAEADEPEDEKLPPIEPPRSWTQAEKDRFNSLPRETQEYLSHREQERDTAIRQRQNELAEQRKALEAEFSKAKQLQTEYESRLPQLVKTLEAALQNEFADIQTMNDVRQLQAQDPFRFQQWQLRQMELAEAHRQQNEVQTKEETARATQWNDHVQKENAAFLESLSDADKAKINDRLKEAPVFLEKLGFTPQELADYASGKDRLSIYDRRVQSLIHDGMKYREIVNAPKVVAKPDIPPVQKPGHAGAANNPATNLRSLESRLNQTGSVEDAWALYEARMKSGRRAS